AAHRARRSEEIRDRRRRCAVAVIDDSVKRHGPRTAGGRRTAGSTQHHIAITKITAVPGNKAAGAGGGNGNAAATATAARASSISSQRGQRPCSREYIGRNIDRSAGATARVAGTCSTFDTDGPVNCDRSR